MATKKPAPPDKTLKAVKTALAMAADPNRSSKELWPALRKVELAYTGENDAAFQRAIDALLLHPMLEPHDPEGVLPSVRLTGFSTQAIFRNPAAPFWLLTDADRARALLQNEFRENYQKHFDKKVKRSVHEAWSGLQHLLEARFELPQPYDLGRLSDRGLRQAMAVMTLTTQFGEGLMRTVPKLDLTHLAAQVDLHEQRVEQKDILTKPTRYEAFVRVARAIEQGAGWEPIMAEEEALLGGERGSP